MPTSKDQPSVGEFPCLEGLSQYQHGLNHAAFAHSIQATQQIEGCATKR